VTTQQDTELDLAEAVRMAQERLKPIAAAEDAKATDVERDQAVAERMRILEIQDLASQRYMKEKASRLFKQPEAPMNLAEELARDYPPLTARIEGLSWVGSRVTVAGKAKAGKTTLGINIVRSLADGTPFLGNIPVTPPEGNIGYLNYEMSPSQFITWMRKAGIKRPDRVVPLNLQGLPMPLLAEQTQEWLIKWAKERNVQVLVMDPWSKVIVGSGSEDKNDDVNAITAILDRIKLEAGIEDLFVIAHMGHADHDDGQERARGASAFMGWPDVMWTLNRSGDVRLLQAEGRDVHFESSELIHDDKTVSLSLTGLKASKSQINAKKGADEVVLIVTNLPGLSTADLKAKITATRNVGEQTSAINEAVASGRIHRREGKGTAKLHYPGPDPALAGVDLSSPGIQGFLSSVRD
jgi:hypothetical protein